MGGKKKSNRWSIRIKWEKMKSLIVFKCVLALKSRWSVLATFQFLFFSVCTLSHSVVSDSLELYWLKPTRLLCPWDSSGKNAGVAYHAFLRNLPGPEVDPESPALKLVSLLTEPPGKPRSLVYTKTSDLTESWNIIVHFKQRGFVCLGWLWPAIIWYIFIIE